jgi:hypothetical protein
MMRRAGPLSSALDHRCFDFAHEAMFGNLKTKGFNLEDTHLTNADKLSTLFALLALAVACR